METIWIIGLGHFGLRALNKLAEKAPDARFVLVDPDPENLSKGEGPGRTLRCMDGVRFVYEHLEEKGGPDWIIPALPVHLAAEWALLRLGPDRLRRVSLPEELERILPHPLRGSDGEVYVTHATFRCPDNCAEPEDICTVTRKPRGKNMFELLAEIPAAPFKPLVIRSHQLDAGVGGYRPGQMFDLLDRIAGAKGPVLVCTACRCHGVITALERI